MLFLKQIRAHGFKSFAEPTVLDFTHDMIGVVGPNGSGKSNITDAIRWALGEQSAKSLRGGNLDDVVFSGSADHPPLDVAEVTLVFDNQKPVFPAIDSNTVEITRRFNKKTRDSDFFINQERVKMRDIQDFALETGLTKSSIAIISQGTISQFTESKPEQRREIFDEAAGVAKYKKRKREAITKLIRAMDNQQRIQDLANEIGQRLPSLERQAKKAQIYQTKIEELQKYEMTILTNDVQTFHQRIQELTEQRTDLEEKIKILVNEINSSQQEFSAIVNESSFSEQTMIDLNNRFTQTVNRIADLKVKKNDWENREATKNQHAEKDEIHAQQIKKHFLEKQISCQSEIDKKNVWLQNLKTLKEKYDYLTDQYDKFYQDIDTLRRQQMQVKFEKSNSERQKTNSSFSGPMAGVQAIISQKFNLTGVIGTLLSLVKVEEQYQVAVSAVASGSIHSIVMETNQDVKKAIEFLKKNQAGRATFLPLDAISPSTIQGMQRDAIEQQPGFIGFANQLVNIESKYQKALDYVLGTVIIVDRYDDATRLARTINYRYNIVTLDGQRILPHGAIIGGKIKNQNLFANLQTSNVPELDFATRLKNLETEEIDKTQEMNTFKMERDRIRDEINSLQTNIRMTTDQIEQLEQSFKDLSEDYRILTGKSLIKEETSKTQTEPDSIKLTKQIAKLEVERDQIQLEINNLSANKNKYAERQRELNAVNMQKQKELDDFKDALRTGMADLTLLTERQDRYLKRLAETYNLTAETVFSMTVTRFENEEEVRERIEILTKELKQIGQVNLEAIEEHQREKERYEYFEVQRKEVLEAIQKLEAIIKDIDVAMETQFKKVVDDVNLALPTAFQKLFGGGNAKLIYTDPDNILETGIDIQVNPPGKRISNLNLLSGGEKSLVALSVLFSILRVRPLPLVILDEAEAPLDPANVERFARYVQQFTDQTQFIIVTHREGTMENCDLLFGVTMETKGITKIVKIKLLDAKQLAINEEQIQI